MKQELRDALGFLGAGLILLGFGLWAKQLATSAFGTVLALIGCYNLFQYFQR
ncbi:hypothetical protein [Furfurilactobacillus curtus]|uniref:DUF2892 domain-containing protein n=1 Tax=Furfurilactobacillus curtus TaxID=1746200 RepID=A0ABQ5JU31_9LACO